MFAIVIYLLYYFIMLDIFWFHPIGQTLAKKLILSYVKFKICITSTYRHIKYFALNVET